MEYDSEEEWRIQQYRNELRNKLNYVISCLTKVSSIGSAISSDLYTAYDYIDNLKKYLLGNKYIQLVDIFNFKANSINSDLYTITTYLPSKYENIAKNEASDNSIYISSVNYSNFSRITYLPRYKTDDGIVFDENRIRDIQSDVNTKLTKASNKVESLLNISCSYYDLHGDISNYANSLSSNINTLKSNMNNKLEETITKFVAAENFAIQASKFPKIST